MQEEKKTKWPGSQVSVWNNFEGLTYRHAGIWVCKEKAEVSMVYMEAGIATLP